MASVKAGSLPLDFRDLDFGRLVGGASIIATPTALEIDYGGDDRDIFTGVDLAFDATGEPVGGEITGYRSVRAGELALSIEGTEAQAAAFIAFARHDDTVGGVFHLLSGDDLIEGSAFADFIAGGAGQDTISGAGGTDTLIGNAGDDLIQGGPGRDQATFSSSIFDYAFTRLSGREWVLAHGVDGADRLIDVEWLLFSDRVIQLAFASPTVEAASDNILRAAPLDAAAMLVANGVMTEAVAIDQLVTRADATTSVATLSYQFFTGRIPSAAGVDYLVSPKGPNANNLNSAYYQDFSLENRYINFAVNLGRDGEGSARFLAEYGGLDLAAATQKAYGVIFGSAPSSDKVAALLAEGRDLYFEAYGQDGPEGQGSKAAMVGWLLAEAAKADVGMYARSNEAFLLDLADGAEFSVDLVGVYGEAGYALL